MTTIGSTTGVRWLIRLELARLTRLGETIDTGLAWAVTPITGRYPNRRKLGGPTFFTSRAAAFRFVAQESRRIYGRNHR